MAMLEAIAAIVAVVVVMSVAFTAMFFGPDFYRDHLMVKALKRAVEQEELSDSLKEEAKALLKGDDNLSRLKWIKNNQDQFSGELLKMAQKAIRTDEMSGIYFWSLIALVVAIAVIFGG